MGDAENELQRIKARNARYDAKIRQQGKIHFHLIVPTQLHEAYRAAAVARGVSMTEIALEVLAAGLPGSTAIEAAPLCAPVPPPRRTVPAPTGRPKPDAPVKPLHLHQKAAILAKEDAANRVPVVVDFGRNLDYVAHGIRQMLRDNGMRKRGTRELVGRLRPERAEYLRPSVEKEGGTLRVTGGLGEAP